MPANRSEDLALLDDWREKRASALAPGLDAVEQGNRLVALQVAEARLAGVEGVPLSRLEYRARLTARFAEDHRETALRLLKEECRELRAALAAAMSGDGGRLP